MIFLILSIRNDDDYLNYEYEKIQIRNKNEET